MDYITKDDSIIFSHLFNKELDSELLKNYKKIIFSDYELNETLFDRYENKNLNYIGSHFNQPLSNSLDNLTNLQQLTLGYNFNQRLDIPFNIRILTLDCNNQYMIDYLPNSIEELNLGLNFNLKLNDLPSSIKKISFDVNSQYNLDLNCLPYFTEIIKLNEYYNKPIKNIPYGLKKLICSSNYKYINDFVNYEVETY